MRLTLRTMLAYLDDVLEPADAAVLGEKIKESEFASNLISRIRTAISKQRLGAPPVDGKGIGQDPNSVAEYLDSTLPADRVPDFERVCLESDGHLAEVAACHQILTLVLGKPAAVPQHLRERAYRFGSSMTEGSPITSHTPSTPVAGEGLQLGYAPTEGAAQAGVDIAAQPSSPTTAADPAHTQTVARNDDEPIEGVPEYLREGRRRSRIAALAVAIGGLLIVGGLGFLVARQFFPADDLAQVDPAPNPTTQPATEPAEPGGTPSQAVSPAEAGDPPPIEPTTEGTQPPATSPATNGSNPPATESPAPSPTPPPASNGEDRIPDTIDIPPAPVSPETPAVTEEPVENLPSTETPATPATEPPDNSVASNTPSTPAATEVNPPTAPATEGTPPTEEVSPVDVGRYLSGDKVLARLAPDGQWMRLPANSPIRSGNRVIALPAYRPQIALTSGITLTLDGATRLEFLRPTEGEQPEISLKYGRILAISVAKEGSTIGLTIGDLHGTVRLADTNTMLAVEVTPVQTVGVDPELQPSQLDINLICLTGRIDWIADLGNAVAIAAGEQYAMRDTGIGQLEKFAAPPAWVDDKTTTLPDRDAARMLEQRLVADRPLALTLSEVVNGPRGDLRSIAVRSLAYLDNHDYFIAALNDASQRSSWAAELDAVKHALARSPQAAAEVRKSLEKERGAGAKELYRLLWGYSAEDLANGADAKLVEYLDHDAQEFRVLAIENLRRITGATHLYRPEYTPQRRKMYVQTWRKDLEEGKIRYPAEEE